MYKKFIIVLSLLFASIGSAQVTGGSKNDVKNFFKVGGDVFTAPAHFDSKDWLIASSTLGLTAASFLIDKDIKAFALKKKGVFGDNLFKIDDIYHIEFVAASIAALYIYGVAAKDQDVRNLGLRLTEATAYASSITLLGKFLIGRERPATTNDALNFDPPNTSWQFISLPSGHTTLSFAYSTVMASAYNNFIWKFSWYTLAALVGAARIYNNAHWFSDVLLGGAIGYFVGEFVNNHHTNQKEIGPVPLNHTAPSYSINFGFAF